MGKLVSIVTGANTGIGKEVASGLMGERGGDKNHHVILACRRLSHCETAKSELLQLHPNATAECMYLDLEDFNSVRKFVSDLSSRDTSVAALINNAGVMGVSSSAADSSTDPKDRHFVINHLGTYLLTRLISPLMAPHGRIVTVGSEAHRRAHLKFKTLPNNNKLALDPGHPSYWYAQYARSKLGNSLMTAELSRRLEYRKSSVRTSCVSPGRVATDIFRNLTGVVGVAVGFLANTVFQTPQQGAAGILTAAMSEEFANRNVAYIHHSKEAIPSKLAQDTELAEQLWRFSNQEVGISEEEDESLWPKF